MPPPCKTCHPPPLQGDGKIFWLALLAICHPPHQNAETASDNALLKEWTLLRVLHNSTKVELDELKWITFVSVSYDSLQWKKSCIWHVIMHHIVQLMISNHTPQDAKLINILRCPNYYALNSRHKYLNVIKDFKCYW